MNVVVCVKQVPDPNSPGQLDPSSHTLKRDGELVLDPGDEFGVEAGLQLAEKHGGEVTVVSMGPDRGVDAVRKALAMGAAKGVLITDDSLAGSDALTTAKVLAAAIRKQEFDVVITATEFDRRLHGRGAADARRPARHPRGDLRQVGRVRGRHAAGGAPDGDRHRGRRGQAAGGHQRHRRRQRAPLPVAQGDHGRQAEAARPSHRRRPRPRRRSAARRPVRRSPPSPPRRNAPPARSSRTTARPPSGSSTSSPKGR